ncbi:hypothetical protein ATN84_06415 [Paramesorhizobium deserti]|uniref:Uncharacterized protein n=1 Tax=Paramesorhizobium deserti TaxID=1494590 RepID=A0A135I1L5_9HYPH|nr:hypothetical protein [Paramesorhizobium deserti]KXF79339.1 hypothetical protein ATN84_06415 [Paramesorhizobium deserti]
MAEGDRKGFSGFRVDNVVEDAEFESIAPQGDRPRVMQSSAPAPFEPDHLAILKTGTRRRFVSPEGRLPGTAYWALVVLAASSAFWMSGGHVLFR